MSEWSDRCERWELLTPIYKISYYQKDRLRGSERQQGYAHISGFTKSEPHSLIPKGIMGRIFLKTDFVKLLTSK